MSAPSKIYHQLLPDDDEHDDGVTGAGGGELIEAEEMMNNRRNNSAENDNEDDIDIDVDNMNETTSLGRDLDECAISTGGSSSLRGQASSPLHSRSGDNTSCPVGGGGGGGGTSPTALSRSRTNSFDMGSDWDDDDDDDNDEAGLRRYHLEFPTSSGSPSSSSRGGGGRSGVYHPSRNVPLPVEFERGNYSSIPSRIWHSFLQLRQGARQRRAARLLTMPSESFQYKLHACLLTWCCDATDRGILLVASCVALWLFIGWAVAIQSAAYWWTGILIFLVRVSARRATERIVGMDNCKRRTRHRRSIMDDIEMGTGSDRSRNAAVVSPPDRPYSDNNHHHHHPSAPTNPPPAIT